MKVTGRVIHDPSYSSRTCIDLGGGRSLEPDVPAVFLNHSCDPNCELILAGGDAVELRTTEGVSAGQELTIDYAWGAEDEPYPCRCGVEKCRQYIVDATELPKLLASLRSRAKRSPPLTGC